MEWDGLWGLLGRGSKSLTNAGMGECSRYQPGTVSITRLLTLDRLNCGSYNMSYVNLEPGF